MLVITGCSSLGVILTGTVGTSPPPERRPSNERVDYPSYKSLGIPKGHLPPPGRCRIWQPGGPPGQQGPPMDCREAFHSAPAGYWILERPTKDENLLNVHEVHSSRAGVVIEVEIYTLN